MKTFEKITKRYALASSYYKHRQIGWPDTLAEIYDYLQQHGELPFRYEGDNWSYDTMCERQKRAGVYLSQYLTPDCTARQMAALAVRYFDNDSRIVDACCGTGQLTRAMIAEGVHPSAIVGFDVDRELVDIYERLYPTVGAMQIRFEDIDFRCENIIANPPFETAACISFFDWLNKEQISGDCRLAITAWFYRQATAQSHTGNDATFYHPLPDTHAGAVRTNGMPCGDRRVGMYVKRGTVYYDSPS